VSSAALVFGTLDVRGKRGTDAMEGVAFTGLSTTAVVVAGAKTGVERPVVVVGRDGVILLAGSVRTVAVGSVLGGSQAP